jgi:CDP-glucose 4,6-dehydratase
MIANPDAAFWGSQRVLVTGHTGFKGTWLGILLNRLGATLVGLALDPPTRPSAFHATRSETLYEADLRVDIRNLDDVVSTIRRLEPTVIFHLAAAPIVLDSYRDPVECMLTNVMGTQHVLEGALRQPSVGTVIVVTTDKVYRNRSWPYPYRETDDIGAADPYSTSKACAELITESYRLSFASPQQIRLGTVRAGNVLGGGDWAPHRLVPDYFRAKAAGTPLRIRNPDATRPWQHVLDPLVGYLLAAESLLGGHTLHHAWNFGPPGDASSTVSGIVSHLDRLTGGSTPLEIESRPERESSRLELSSSLARDDLGWHARWGLSDSLQATSDWYRSWDGGLDMLRVTQAQVDSFLAHT